MDEQSALVMLSARDIYTDQLVRIMIPPVVKYFQTLWSEARQKKRAFQLLLQQVPALNRSQLEGHTNQILLKHPFLGDIVAAVFLAVVKIMSHVRLPGSKSNVRVAVPANTVFVHAVLTCAAKDMFEMVLEGKTIFDARPTVVNSVQKQIVKNAVKQAIQSLIPYKELLDAYIADEVDAENTVSPEPFPGTVHASPHLSRLGEPIRQPPPSEHEEEPAEPEHEPKHEDGSSEHDSHKKNWLDEGSEHGGSETRQIELKGEHSMNPDAEGAGELED